MSEFNVLELITPELLILIPTCWGIGLLIKSSKLPNRAIPIVNCIISILLAVLYLFTMNPTAPIGLNIFSAFTQGVVCWIIAWITYEKVIKRAGNKLNISNDDVVNQENDSNTKG